MVFCSIPFYLSGRTFYVYFVRLVYKMDTFGTRYAYKIGKKGSPTRKKKSSPKPYIPAMVFANEFDDSPTEEMIRKGRRKPGHSVNSYTERIKEMMTPRSRGGKKRGRKTLRKFRNRQLFRK
jgi:hypothetical protein